MRFGLMLNHTYARDADIGERLAGLVRLTETARDAGFATLLNHHHYMANLPTPQALPVLSRLIPHAGGMRLGVGVYLATFEHPIQLAENFATVDQLSGGRLIMGVGVGYRDEELKAFGVERASRGRRLVETLEVVAKLWTGDRVTHQGEFFQLDEVAIGITPLQRPRPPFWIGANAPRTIERAARIGEAWLPIPRLAATTATRYRDLFRSAGEAAGRDVTAYEYPIARELYIGESDAAAEAAAAPYLAQEYAAMAAYGDVYSREYAAMWQDAFLVGSADTVIDKIRALEAAGFDQVLVRVNWADAPISQSVEQIGRFAAEVMPAFGAVPV